MGCPVHFPTIPADETYDAHGNDQIQLCTQFNFLHVWAERDFLEMQQREPNQPECIK